MMNAYDYESFDEEIENDSRQISVCAECGEKIYDDCEDIYVDDELNHFCCIECALRYYSIRKIEDC